MYSAGEALGILPLCVRTEMYRLNKVRVLTYPLDNWSTWYGPIGPNPASTMLAAMGLDEPRFARPARLNPGAGSLLLSDALLAELRQSAARVA